MSSEIHVCVTCERAADPVPAPSRGECLARALEAAAAGGSGAVGIRRVDCLGRCLSPGNVDLLGRGKVQVTLTALEAADAGAVLATAIAHHGAADFALADIALEVQSRALIRPDRRRRRMQIIA